MAKRNKSIFELILIAPWQVGFCIGIASFLGIRYGIGWYFQSSGNQVLQPLGKLISAGAYAPLAWGALIVCWMGALFSYIGRRVRGNLVETQTGIESLRAMSWRQFETLVGEAFRRRGYAVEETGLGGADGGVDLKLRLNDRVELLQCKHWRTQQVGVDVVRATWGIVMHERANGAKIVCVGRFTPAAIEFAQGKTIELIGGDRLLALVREVQTAPAKKLGTPAKIVAPAMRVESAPDRFKPPGVQAALACPQCGNTMIQRLNKTTQDPFWGCSGFPKCRGTREFSA